MLQDMFKKCDTDCSLILNYISQQCLPEMFQLDIFVNLVHSCGLIIEFQSGLKECINHLSTVLSLALLLSGNIKCRKCYIGGVTPFPYLDTVLLLPSTPQ